MNDDAVLYVVANKGQRYVTTKVLDEFAPLMQWRQDGSDSVLDIGCGTGDVTIELILPILPPSFTRLIGSDLSDGMIKYAQQHYSHPKVTYEKLDIGEDVDEFLTKFGRFDHVVSFFCLHWVRNLKQALTSIRKLLTPNGDCLLAFVISQNVYTVYEDLLKSEKWSKYMKDFELILPAHHNDTSCPINKFELLCESVGFGSHKIKSLDGQYICEDYEQYKNFYKSINPLLQQIPIDEQDEFMLEVLERQMERNIEMSESKLLISANIIIIFAKNDSE